MRLRLRPQPRLRLRPRQRPTRRPQVWAPWQPLLRPHLWAPWQLLAQLALPQTASSHGLWLRLPLPLLVW